MNTIFVIILCVSRRWLGTLAADNAHRISCCHGRKQHEWPHLHSIRVNNGTKIGSSQSAATGASWGSSKRMVERSQAWSLMSCTPFICSTNGTTINCTEVSQVHKLLVSKFNHFSMRWLHLNILATIITTTTPVSRSWSRAKEYLTICSIHTATNLVLDCAPAASRLHLPNVIAIMGLHCQTCLHRR